MGIEVNLPSENGEPNAPSVGVALDFTKKKAQRAAVGPFERAPTIARRPKIFLWGDTGTRKTRTALEFPNPVVIDTEGGTELYGATTKFDRIVTSDFDEADKAIAWLLKNKHGYSTVIVDPITVLWESVQRKWRDIFLARRARLNPNGSRDVIEDFDFAPLDWQKIKSDLKSFIHKLTMLDATVIVTARMKDLRSGDGKDFMRKVGETFDGEKSLPYLFDTVVRTFKSDSGEFMGECLKDRSNKMPAKPFVMGLEVFQTAFGQKELARKVKPVDVVSEETAAAIRAALASRNLDESNPIVSRSLGKYGVERIDDLKASDAEVILNTLTNLRVKEGVN